MLIVEIIMALSDRQSLTQFLLEAEMAELGSITLKGAIINTVAMIVDL